MQLTLFSNRSKLRLSRKKAEKNSHKKNRNNLFVFRLQFFPPHCFCFATKTITLHVKVSEKVTTPKKRGKVKSKKNFDKKSSIEFVLCAFILMTLHQAIQEVFVSIVLVLSIHLEPQGCHLTF